MAGGTINSYLSAVGTFATWLNKPRPRTELISYLMARMERSFAAAQRLVDALDSAALSERVPVSRALAARVLDKAAKGGA